jgi:peptide/nickel transport system permease protein
MALFIARRLIFSVLVLFVVITVTFFGIRLTGDPVATQLTSVGASQQEIAQMEHALGYDRPVAVQYLDYLGKVARGNLGVSIRYQQGNLGLIKQRLPYTLELAGAALLIIFVLALPLGILAAVNRGRVVDRAVQSAVSLGQAVPSFVIGPILILVFAVRVHWFPVAGVAGVKSIVLPALTLAIYPLSQIARLLRSSMLDVWHSDFVTTARAKGAREGVVVMRHILRNALLPVLTLVGLQVAGLLGGAVIVESIFGWPGIGRFAIQALLAGDFSLAEAIVVVMTALVVTVNLLTDLAYMAVDPRIQLR